jgi:TetR/AcrR family transcriptional regulator, mexCD-oprJ operon repressor
MGEVRDTPVAAPSRAPRADARRNIAAILDAARDTLIDDPDATVAQIAQRAGVGRVTLYGHFATRAELVDAVFAQVSAEADAVLDGVDTSGDPVEALTRLVNATWRLVHRSRSLVAAVERELPAERVRQHHDRHLARAAELVRKGRAEGVFRTDLPEQWLVTTMYTLMHAAAAEVRAGRLDGADAGPTVATTVVAAWTPPTPTRRGARAD